MGFREIDDSGGPKGYPCHRAVGAKGNERKSGCARACLIPRDIEPRTSRRGATRTRRTEETCGRVCTKPRTSVFDYAARQAITANTGLDRRGKRAPALRRRPNEAPISRRNVIRTSFLVRGIR